MKRKYMNYDVPQIIKTSKIKSLSVAIMIINLFFVNGVFAKNNLHLINKETQNQVINELKLQLKNGYVFPQKAVLLNKVLDQYKINRNYKETEDSNEFALSLTKQLQEETGDLHLRVEYSKEVIADASNSEELAVEQEFEMEMWKKHNYGIEKIERLPFNIGYLQITAFAPTQNVGRILASAMNLINNTESLIIDLRGNFGGEEQTVQLLASYFFEERTHLIDMYKRKNNFTEQHWSHDYVEGDRYDKNKDVYLLVDKESFSAAEDFSYTMKHLKRAKLVGETTAGAANSGDYVTLTKHFRVFLPNGRGISPITGTNWEGVGVSPDVEVATDQALNTAQVLVLEKMLKDKGDTRLSQRIYSRISLLKSSSLNSQD